jgi:hypothetical protein
MAMVRKLYQIIRTRRENFRAGEPPIGKFYQILLIFYETLALVYEVEAKNYGNLFLKYRVENKIYGIEVFVYEDQSKHNTSPDSVNSIFLH